MRLSGPELKCIEHNVPILTEGGIRRKVLGLNE